jgi:hypothetical protein
VGINTLHHAPLPLLLQLLFSCHPSRSGGSAVAVALACAVACSPHSSPQKVVISTEAVHSLIVNRVVERPPHFAVAFAVARF